MTYQVVQIPVDEIKFFVRRARREMPYSRLKQSIKEVGLKTPIGVRDITNRPRSKRRRPNGGHYKYELVFGQGRLQAFREIGITKIPAQIVDVPEEEIVGRFLAENMMRRKLSWAEKADLISRDIEDHGLTVEEVANRYCITLSHAKKYLRVMNGASDKALERAEDGELDMTTTEKLTTIPKEDQDIVIEVLEDDEFDKSAVMHLVDEAARLRKEKKDVTKDALRKSMEEVNLELKKLRKIFKFKRFEYSQGPQNLYRLCENQRFAKLAEERGVDLTHFTK